MTLVLGIKVRSWLKMLYAVCGRAIYCWASGGGWGKRESYTLSYFAIIINGPMVKQNFLHTFFVYKSKKSTNQLQ